MTTHLEPDILECEVKWTLGSIATNKAGGDWIPAELLKILKDDSVRVLHSICQQVWKIQQWAQDWKRSVFIPIPKKGSAKECRNYQLIALISHANKVMPKILQARPQQCVNHSKVWKILKYMGVPDHLICFLRKLCVGQEAAVRTGHETSD